MLPECPGWMIIGAKALPPSPASSAQASPVEEVTVGSNDWVTALSPTLAVSGGAPPGPNGPISSGLRSHSPWLISGSLNVRLAESPPLDSVTPLSGTAGETSGSPGKYSRSNVTGALDVAVAWSCAVSGGTTYSGNGLYLQSESDGAQAGSGRAISLVFGTP